MIGTDTLLPRAFGFTEYADLLELLDAAGYEPGIGPGARYAVFTYDWRRDLVESARHLALRLEGLAKAAGDPDARFHLIGYSMGGLVSPLLPALRRRGAAAGRARHLGRGAPHRQPDPGGDSQRRQHPLPRGDPRTASASASRTRRSRPPWCSACPRSTSCCRRRGRGPLVDTSGRVLGGRPPRPGDLAEVRLGPVRGRRRAPGAAERDVRERRARAGPRVPRCARASRGHTLPGAGLRHRRGLPADTGPRGRRRQPPGQLAALRGDARRKEQDLLFEPGDGRVTRSSLLGSHLPGAAAGDTGSGYSETTRVFFGSSDHHGLFAIRRSRACCCGCCCGRPGRQGTPHVVARARAAGI